MQLSLLISITLLLLVSWYPKASLQKISIHQLEEMDLNEHQTVQDNNIVPHDDATVDHLLMEKWLVDNIKDLHRELKQTESDVEHYVQVTKSIMSKITNKVKLIK